MSTSKLTRRSIESLTDWSQRNLGAFVVTVGLLVIWQGYSSILNTRGNIYFPSPTYVVSQTAENMDRILAGIRVTSLEILFGFVLAVVFGVLLGVVFAEWFVLRQAALPTLVVTYSMPHAIFAPLFLIWFGMGVVGVSIFVAWLAFFPLFVNTLTGFNQVDEEFLHLAELAGATRWQRIRKIKFWVALPHITSGLKVAVQQSIVGAIVAEFIATGGGLGYLIVSAISLLQEGMMFGILIIIMLFSITFYMVISWLIEIVVPGPSGSV